MLELADKIAALRNEGVPFAVATIVKSAGSTPRKTGTSMIVFADGKIYGTLGGGNFENMVIKEAKSAIKQGISKLVSFNISEKETPGRIKTGEPCGGEADVYIETSGKPFSIFIFGGGHIGGALVKLASFLGWKWTVIDDREEFARKFSGIHSSYENAFGKISIPEGSAIVIVTKGHLGDKACLKGALKTKAFYIGVIGSRSKRWEFDKILKGDKRVYMPIGLDISDDSPEEIALSIVAEILKLKNRGSGRHLSRLKN